MASLLPHKTLAYKGTDVLVDGKSSVAGERDGTYWGIATHLEDYKLVDAAGKPDDRFGYLAKPRPWWKDTADLASTPTRLAAVESSRQEALIDWGYVVCDAALRAHAAAKLEQAPYNIKTLPAVGIPYPNPS